MREKEKYVRWPSDEALNNFKRPVRRASDDPSMRPPPANVPTWTSARYCLAYMAFFGFFNVYALRVNLSVAIISMMNSTDEKSNATNECPTTGSNTTNHTQHGEFNWSSSQKALVLGSFFYGYICTQVIGGYLAGRYGGKYLFGCGVLCTTVFTLLTPIAARTDFRLLIATRVIEGIGEGVTFPAMHALWGVWCPPLERSKLVSMGYAGAHFGTVIAQPVSGLLCASKFLGGWPSVFYVFGTVGLIWCLLWFFLAHSRPADHPRIGQAELDYIQSTVSQEPAAALTDIPWKSILLSYRVWAIAAAHFANNWGFYTLLTCLPTYLKNILGYDISQNGFISALPYFTMWIMINLSGFIADALRERGFLNTTQTRKIFNSIGLLSPAGFLVAAGFVHCNNALTISLICLATTFNACTFSGFNANHIDVASRYAGILMGITNTVATIPGFVSPIVVQSLTGEHETRERWRYVFYIAAGVYILGTIIFATLGTGVEQRWNRAEYHAKIPDDISRLLPSDEEDDDKALQPNTSNNSNWDDARHRVVPYDAIDRNSEDS